VENRAFLGNVGKYCTAGQAADDNMTRAHCMLYRGAGKSLARPGRKQATATEDFDFHISYLLPQLEQY